jgi:23S rRNA pseudouridine1911/1915/1917 synthase
LIPGASNRTLRQMLAHGRIRVNGEICRLPGRQITPADSVGIAAKSVPVQEVPGLELEVVWEDRDLVVVLKPSGLLTVATPTEKEKTVHGYLRRRTRNRGQKIYVIHRLDKYASGLLVFAKSEAVQETMKKLFEKHAIERRYWAIVEGRMATDSGTIRSRLVEGPDFRVRSTREPGEGKPAVTHYRVLRRFPSLTALEMRLETGRKNQIRVHLSEMKHPVVGDRSYGSSTDPLGRLGLHAFSLGFRHPVNGTPLHFETEIPKEFRPYLPEPRRLP